MTVKQVFICDRCNKEQQTRQENGGYPPLWKIKIICEAIDNYDRYLPSPSQVADWCKSCVEKMGVCKPLLRAGEPEQPPTMDDLVRTIVENALANQG